MSLALRRGQVLKGKLGSYSIIKEVQDTVWFANPYIRPLIDEIEDPADPTTIALAYLEDDLLTASMKRRLSRSEIKLVARRVLTVIDLLHNNGYVYTDIKSNNIFVNYHQGEKDIRFSNVQLGDFGSTYHIDSQYARDAVPIGAPVWRSPEAMLNLHWNSATDIWSFGTLLISLLYSGDFNIFKPKGYKFGDDGYEFMILLKHVQFFGPFPTKWAKMFEHDLQTCFVVTSVLEELKEFTLFENVTEVEICKDDKEFVCRMMKMDYRDRPTAGELLNDRWFEDVD